MNNTFYTRIQNKIDTLENFTTNNPLILKGETVLVKDGDKIKIKVGIEDSAYFNDIPYLLQNSVADWMQNDSTSPDYIKNRTHYVSTGLVDILPECELVADDPENLTGEFYITQSFDEIVAGNVYTITYNKIDYTLTAQSFTQEGLTASIIGDMGIMTGSPTGEAPFVMICVPPSQVAATGGIYAIVADPTCPASITIGIKYEGEIIHQLDSKYIKDMYYTEIKEPGFVLPPVTLEISNSQTYLPGTIPLSATLGETYTVVFNDEEYQCIATEFNEDIPVAIGNKSIAFGGEDTGEPFVVFIPTLEFSSQNGCSAIVFVQDSSLTSATLSIKDTGIIIHKVPEEYLPKGLVKEENVTDLVKLHNSLELKDTGEIGLSSSYINTINSASSQSTTNKNSISTLNRNVSSLTSNLSTVQTDLAELDEEVTNLTLNKVGKNVEGQSFTIGEETFTAEDGTEIFNDYNGNIAIGNNSHSEGLRTTAQGKQSHAEGIDTIAKGDGGSHAEGDNTTASGKSSHAEGELTEASSWASHAEGYSSVASGHSSHAEGHNTTASGAYSHVEGNETTASDTSAHAEGHGTTASGVYSHAQGNKTTASEIGAHAEGRETIASSPYAHAEGSFTIAASGNQHVQGKYNLEDAINKYAHIIGNGTSKDARSNAHTIDWDGNAWFQKDVYVGGTSQDNAEKLAKQSEIPVIDSTLINSEQAADAKATGDAIKTVEATIANLDLVGKTTTGTEYTVEEETLIAGKGAEIFNNYNSNKAIGNYSHAEGTGTVASGHASHAEGANTIASNFHSHAEGLGAIASGHQSHAEGYYTTASGDYSHAEGSGTIAAGYHQHVQGSYNIEDTKGQYAHIIGNGHNDTSRLNIHTVDWVGRAWYAGDVYVGGSDWLNGEKLIKQSDLPAIDSTLSNSGQVADAKAVGDALAEKQTAITGTEGQFVVIGADGTPTTKTILNAEEVSF